jgi:hypothetical protein
MTLDDRCYYETRGTCAVSTLPNSSDRSSDISGSLLLPSTATMGHLTSVGHCYCWACRMLLAPTVVTDVLTKVAITTGPHSTDVQVIRCYWTASSDERSDISGPLLLDYAAAMT